MTQLRAVVLLSLNVSITCILAHVRTIPIVSFVHLAYDSLTLSVIRS